MAAVGCFDSFGNIHRAQFFHEGKDKKTFVEKLMAYGAKQQDPAQQAQASLFDMVTNEEDSGALPPIPECEPWSSFEQLRHEREIAGFYISGHPLDHFKPIIESCCNTDLSTFSKDKESWYRLSGRRLVFAAIVTAAQHRIGKNGNPYGIITLEDYQDSYEWMLFGEYSCAVSLLGVRSRE